MMEEIIFYREWLPLDKREFRILAMLADKGTFKGNLSDLCRYFSLSPQSSNRNNLRNSIELLSKQCFITVSKTGNSYTLNTIPKATEIRMLREWMKRILARDYTTEQVAWEQVLKVYLWIVTNQNDVIRNDDIAGELNISISTVGCAKNVLSKEYEAIRREYVTVKLGDDFYKRIGQNITAVAWWSSK